MKAAARWCSSCARSSSHCILYLMLHRLVLLSLKNVVTRFACLGNEGIELRSTPVGVSTRRMNSRSLEVGVTSVTMSVGRGLSELQRVGDALEVCLFSRPR